LKMSRRLQACGAAPSSAAEDGTTMSPTLSDVLGGATAPKAADFDLRLEKFLHAVNVDLTAASSSGSSAVAPDARLPDFARLLKDALEPTCAVFASSEGLFDVNDAPAKVVGEALTYCCSKDALRPKYARGGERAGMSGGHARVVTACLTASVAASGSIPPRPISGPHQYYGRDDGHLHAKVTNCGGCQVPASGSRRRARDLAGAHGRAADPHLHWVRHRPARTHRTPHIHSSSPSSVRCQKATDLLPLRPDNCPALCCNSARRRTTR
jgi:hypothetical protein